MNVYKIVHMILYFLEYKPEYLELIECDQATIVKEEKRSMEVCFIKRIIHR